MSRHTQLDWPNSIDRTPAADREHTTKFSATLGQTTQELATELDRADHINEWRASIANAHTKSNGLPLANASPDDPAFVLRWRDGDGNPHAVGCDRYVSLGSNVRAVYKWVNETRLRAQRPVSTAADNFAAAALPSAGDDAIAPEPPEREPHTVLEVAPDASESVIEAAARSKKAAAHPDSDVESEWTIDDVERAKETLLR